MLTTFTLVSGVALAPEPGGCLRAYHTAPPKPAAMTRATRRLRRRMLLSPLQEEADAGRNDDQRKREEDVVLKHVHLRLSRVEPPVLGLFRANGDEIFVRRQQVHGVHRQVAICLETDVIVLDERG